MIFFKSTFAILFSLFTSQFANACEADNITFYEVPLVCGAAPEIGCGSRAKPLFAEMEQHEKLAEAWLNRKGTIIAVVWDNTMASKKERRQIIQSFFEKHAVEATLIKDKKQVAQLAENFRKEGQWYRNSDVDKLSIEEAGVIAGTSVSYAKEAGLIDENEATAIHDEVASYFKKELIQIRTYQDLISSETQGKWMGYVYSVYEKHIGKERAVQIKQLYEKYESCKTSEKSCCSKEGKKSSCSKSKKSL
jgi:hypothetical protein